MKPYAAVAKPSPPRIRLEAPSVPLRLVKPSMHTRHDFNADSDPAATLPRTVGIWRLLKRIHRGDWTDLFLVQPADAAGSPRCDYVLKMVRDNPDRLAEGTFQMRAEIAAATDATHPNLVPVLDASLTARQPYAVMPRLEGDTLEMWLESSPQPLPVALWWVRQATQATAALHAAGWLHRDIKPANLIVSDRGHVTLIDLGFAAEHRSLGDPVFRGTPQYTAPETLGGGGVMLAASDIYSLGTILAELTQTELDLPNAVAKLIESMTADLPKQRPTAEEVIEQLLRLEIETLGRHILPKAA